MVVGKTVGGHEKVIEWGREFLGGRETKSLQLKSDKRQEREDDTNGTYLRRNGHIVTVPAKNETVVGR